MIIFSRICALAFTLIGGTLSAPFSFFDWQLWAILVPFSMAAVFAMECGKRHAQSRAAPAGKGS